MRRLLTLHGLRIVGIVLLVHAVSFSGVSWMGGRAVSTAQGPSPAGPTEVVAVLRAVAAWRDYLAQALLGDLGTIPGAVPRPVADLVAEAFPRSLALLALGLVVAALVGVGAGVWGVGRRAGRTRALPLALSLIGFSMPGFYVGIVLIQLMLQGSRLAGRPGAPLLPASGFGFDQHLVLPVIALALRPAAEIARLVSELLSEELGREYLRMAAAKGLSRRLRLLRHALPNVASTVAVAIGGSIRYLASSLIAVELLFGWNGLGMRLAQSLTARTDGRPSDAFLLHPPTVAALLAVLAAMLLVAHALTELLAQGLDPRQRVPARPGAGAGAGPQAGANMGVGPLARSKA